MSMDTILQYINTLIFIIIWSPSLINLMVSVDIKHHRFVTYYLSVTAVIAKTSINHTVFYSLWIWLN